MNKIYPSAAAALEGVVKSGQLLAVGGFGLCGIPEALIEVLRGADLVFITAGEGGGGQPLAGDDLATIRNLALLGLCTMAWSNQSTDACRRSARSVAPWVRSPQTWYARPMLA